MVATRRWLPLLLLASSGCLIEVKKLYDLDGRVDSVALDGKTSLPDVGQDSGSSGDLAVNVDSTVDTAPDSNSSPDTNSCVAESCNGVDDDCDGKIDNGACEPGCTGKQKGGAAFAFCTTSLSRADAAAACKQMSMELAHIADASENSWILSTAQSLLTEDAWIGGTDSASEGTWVWPDGTTFWVVQDAGAGPGYAAWGQGEPNDEDGEDCLEMVLVAADALVAGDWNDEGCWRTQSFICRE
jgi:hypothetical protein